MDKFIYNGTYSAKCILSDIRKGDKIEYSYTITGRNPIFNNKFCRTIYLQGSGLIAHQYTTLLFSANRKMNIKSFNLRSQPNVTSVGGFERFEWEDYQVPGVLSDKLEPKWFNQYARVQVSDYETWSEVIDWGLKINPLQTNFRGELANIIEKLKKQCGNDQEKYFRRAVTFVQDEVRYMGIETGPYSHKANSPGKVFKQRYGDCKDKSLLLASMLNTGGIEAHMVLVNTDLQDKIEDYIPSTALFDHAVVVAIVNGKQVWVDATMANQGGKGVNLYFPPYKKGLVLKAGNTGLTKITETKTGKIICEENYNITDEYAPVKFTVTTTYNLDEADGIRDHIASSGIAETEKNYLDYYSKTYPKIEAADSIIIKDNREKNELVTIENYTIHDFFKRDSTDGRFNAEFYADFISRELPDVAGRMKAPASVDYPYAIDYKVNIVMSNGWDVANEHYTINRAAYKFICDKVVSNDELSLHYQFVYLKDCVTQDKLAEFKQDIKDLKNDKLFYSFFYIPDIKKVAFQLNRWVVMISFIVMAIFAYGCLKIYKIRTNDTPYYNRNSLPPALGGWLIVLILALFITLFEIAKYLIDEGYYSMSKWNLFTSGMNSVFSKAQLIFEVAGYVAIVSYSVFCLVLIFKKRDITVHYLKLYYVFSIGFLFMNCLLNAILKRELPSYDMEQFIKAVIVAVVCTYYLNASTRVEETFVVPYPN